MRNFGMSGSLTDHEAVTAFKRGSTPRQTAKALTSRLLFVDTARHPVREVNLGGGLIRSFRLMVRTIGFQPRDGCSSHSGSTTWGVVCYNGNSAT